jgi:methylated-DNA-[protein]-cysteine S-methyltransferase
MLSPAPEPAPNPAPDIRRLTVPSPIGALTLFEQDGAITGLTWAAGTRIRNGLPTTLLAEAKTQLAAYFNGHLKVFDLPLAATGTNFQLRIWRMIGAIPFGTTLSYGGLAKKLGSGPRAVAGACGANPIPIIVPCHRVLGADGKLHGYSGRGGVMTKATLLTLEGVRTNV